MGAGIFASFNLADAFLEPRAALHDMDSVGAGVTATVNDVLLGIARAYNDLLEAQANLQIAEENVRLAEGLVQLTVAFSRSGQGLEADASRARNELAHRMQLEVAAKQGIETRSIRLATRLRLDPTTPLRAREPQLIPFQLIPEDTPLAQLIEQASRVRPEIRSLMSTVLAEEQRERQEGLRPLIPELQIGAYGGGFGGGTGSDFDDFSESGEFSVGLVWNLRNLGFGQAAQQRRRELQTRRAKIRLQITRDTVTEEVTVAYVRAREGRRQMELAVENVKESRISFDLNMQRVHGAEGLPIEALQALQAAAEAREAYIRSIADFNRSQLDLLRAIGEPVRP